MKTLQIVENVNNGKVVNKYFNKWAKIKNSTQYEKWVSEVKDVRFGTYGTINLIQLIENYFPITMANEITKRDFLNELKQALQ